jgi:hypothetical protein
LPIADCALAGEEEGGVVGFLVPVGWPASSHLSLSLEFFFVCLNYEGFLVLFVLTWGVRFGEN